MFSVCGNSLNYGGIESYPERVSNITPFINKYKQKVMTYPSKIDDWKLFEKSNPKTNNFLNDPK